MPPRASRYQYETSPRKIEPEYMPTKQRQQQPKKQEETSVREKQLAKKEKLKKQRKLICYILLVFSVLLAISYRNSLINENFAEVKSLKSKLALVEKENQQLQVNIESSLNLNNLEKAAQEKLGMQRLDNNQKIYMSLPKKDYVEPATEQVEIQDNLNIFQKVWNTIIGK